MLRRRKIAHCALGDLLQAYFYTTAMCIGACWRRRCPKTTRYVARMMGGFIMVTTVLCAMGANK
jgi:hypothetical protein